MKKKSEYNNTMMINMIRNQSFRSVALHSNNINVNTKSLNQKNQYRSPPTQRMRSFTSNLSHNATIVQNVEMNYPRYDDENGNIPRPMQSSVQLQAKGTIVTHDDEFPLTPQQVLQALDIWENGYGSISEQTHLRNIHISEQFGNHLCITNTTNVYPNHPYESAPISPITHYGNTRGTTVYNRNIHYSPYSRLPVRKTPISTKLSPISSSNQASIASSGSYLSSDTPTVNSPISSFAPAESVMGSILPSVDDEEELSATCPLQTPFENINDEINGFDDESVFQLFPFIPSDNQSCITGFNL